MTGELGAAVRAAAMAGGGRREGFGVAAGEAVGQVAG
jgi:hypothetical protein